MFADDKVVEIPSLKGKDRDEVAKQASIVNGLLHNIFIDNVDVSSVNKLLYAGSYVVCERLGLLKAKKQVMKSNKPWWQRRLEGSISQW